MGDAPPRCPCAPAVGLWPGRPARVAREEGIEAGAGRAGAAARSRRHAREEEAIVDHFEFRNGELHAEEAPIAVRVNPDVDPKTHPYISTGLKDNKFGVPVAGAERLYEAARAMPGIEIAGVACHIGSQLEDLSPFTDALDRVLALADKLQA